MRSPQDQTEGRYVLAAAVIEQTDVEAARETVRGLALRNRLPFHWRLEQPPRRSKAVDLVAELTALHLVVVGAPLNPAKQERARRLCLARLLHELEVAGVEQVWLEARTPSLNARDIAAVRALRSRRVIHHEIRVDHRYPSDEPLLWIPDIVAGVVGAVDDVEGYRDRLDGVLTTYHIRLD
jgi:hypothetical protein